MDKFTAQLGLMGGLMSMSFIAVAQTPQSAQAASTQTAAAPVLEEIVVTTRRVEENLQDVPGTVVALSAHTLQSAGIRKLENLTDKVAGLVFRNLGGGTPLIAIRGSAPRLGGVSTGVYQDGIALSSSQMSRGPIDVARVEVAKGPQSTLYGRSTAAGAIGLITNDPTSVFEGSLEVGGGGSSAGYGAADKEGIWHAQAILSGPLVGDSLLGRMVVSRQKRDGFIFDPVTGWRAQGYDREYYRGKLVWLPGDTFRAELTVDYTDDNQPRSDDFEFDPNVDRRPVFSPPGFKDTHPVDYGHSVWDTRQTFKPDNPRNNKSATLELKWDLGFGELTSLSGWSDQSEFGGRIDCDGTQYDLCWQTDDSQDRRFSQEFRLAGTAGVDQRLSYLTGVYYLDRDEKSGFRGDGINQGFGALSAQYLGKGLAGQGGRNTSGLENYAAFGQVGYDFTDRFNLTAGLRWARDKISGTIDSVVLRVDGTYVNNFGPFYRDATFDAVTGNLVATYKFTPDITSYASYSKGDRPGGINGGSNPVVASTPYDPEQVDAYEIGLKSTLLDRRLVLNTAVFFNDYSDLQNATYRLLSDGTSANVTTNAATASAYGLELEVAALLSDRWRLDLAYSYLDAGFDNFIRVLPGNIAVDLSDNRLLRSPEHSGNLSITYNRPVGLGDLSATLGTSFSTSYANDLLIDSTNTRFDTFDTEAYQLFNLTASYSWRTWQISGYVNNLTDEEYMAGGAGVGTGFTFNMVGIPGAPRTYEVTLRKFF